MIGNDIVDWAQAKRESNWQRKGFLAKLFTSDEQQLIHEANNPEQLVWTLWCLKESVYKANVRLTGKRIFAPQKIACQLNSGQQNVVEGTAFYGQRYQIRALLTPNYVAGVAFLSDNPPVFQEAILPFNGIDSANQSAHLYRRIRQAGASTLSVPVDTVCLHKNEIGVPKLIITDSVNKSTTLPVSISHHGQYAAFVIGYSDYQAVNFRGGLR